MKIIDIVQLSMPVIGGFVSLLTFCLAIWLYRTSRKVKIAIFSQRVEKDGKTTAKIEVKSLRQRHVVIDAARFPLTVWTRRKNLRVTGLIKTLRLKDEILDSDQDIDYVSQMASCNAGKLPVRLVEDEIRQIECIDLDDMMAHFFHYKESFVNKSFFGIFMFLLHVEVCTTNGRVFRKRAHWEIRYHLWEKYKNDPRTYGGLAG